MPPYVGIEIYFGPTGKARETWQALITYVNLKGGCFVLTAKPILHRKGRLLSAVTIVYLVFHL